MVIRGFLVVDAIVGDLTLSAAVGSHRVDLVVVPVVVLVGDSAVATGKRRLR
jgi:hypothetical protein